MRRLLVLGILSLCAGAHTLAVAQATGSVTGVVLATGKTPAPIRVTIDQKVCGSELPDESLVVDAQGHLANAVVSLAGVKARTAAADTPVTNEKCRFTPRVQIARPNTNVTTTSRDPMLHTTNAATEKGKTLFNVALPAPGFNISKPLGSAGVVRLTCNVHPWMRGFIVVTDEAAAVTGSNGRFALADVPPGTYELRVWHELLKATSQKVSVVAGRATELTIQLK